MTAAEAQEYHRAALQHVHDAMEAGDGTRLAFALRAVDLWERICDEKCAVPARLPSLTVPAAYLEATGR